MKKSLFFIMTLFLVIGFATVSGFLYIRGINNIAENKEDYSIYFSNASLDGINNLKLTSEDKQKIEFETKVLINASETSILNYQVTNASTQYDAEVSVKCSPTDNEYISVSNSLDKTLIKARSWADGELRIRMKKSVTEDINIDLVCKIETNASSRTAINRDALCNELLGKSWEFEYTGDVQDFIVPCDGEYEIDIYGAGGNNQAGISNQMGAGYSTSGSKASGSIELKKDTPLYIYLGEKEGPFNGGGVGGTTLNGVSTSTHGSGASDIRLIKASDNSWYDINHSSWNTDVSLLSRIITAGGGAGVKICTGRQFRVSTPTNSYYNSVDRLYATYPRDGEGSNGTLGLGSSEVTGRVYITDTNDIGNGASGGGGGGYYGGLTSVVNKNITYSYFETAMRNTNASGIGYGIVPINGNRLAGTETHSYSGTSQIASDFSYNGYVYSFKNQEIKIQQNNGNGLALIKYIG